MVFGSPKWAVTNCTDGSPLGLQPLGEFGRIRRFFAPLATTPGALGLADDAALLDLAPDQQFVVTTDALVEGIHFLSTDPPGLIARKALRTNLSDLAAKSARPVGYLLTLSLPRTRDDAWVEAFAAGLARDQAEFSISLLGGDSVSTEGPVTISITAWGVVERGKAVLRSGARPGDLVLVSGTIGDGALGLLAATWRLEDLPPHEIAWLADRYRLPQPRVGLGVALGPFVHAMMDISDGLVADLGHLALASGVDAVIEAARLPLSVAAAAAVADHPALFMSCLAGGDDYELLFTADPANLGVIETLAGGLGVAVTVVGRVVAPRTGQSCVRVVDADGEAVDVPEPGWRHF